MNSVSKNKQSIPNKNSSTNENKNIQKKEDSAIYLVDSEDDKEEENNKLNNNNQNQNNNIKNKSDLENNLSVDKKANNNLNNDKNNEINKNNFEKNFECIVQELDWTCEKEREMIKDKNNLDYIIGSDLVWNPKLREPLANTIKYFMKLNKNIKCFLSFEIRDDEVNKFLSLFNKKEYIIEKIKDELFDEVYKSDEIIIIVITNNNN